MISFFTWICNPAPKADCISLFLHVRRYNLRLCLFSSFCINACTILLDLPFMHSYTSYAVHAFSCGYPVDKFGRERQKPHERPFSLIHRNVIHSLWTMWKIFRPDFRKQFFGSRFAKNYTAYTSLAGRIPRGGKRIYPKGVVRPHPCGWIMPLVHTLSFGQKADSMRG